MFNAFYCDLTSCCLHACFKKAMDKTSKKQFWKLHDLVSFYSTCYCEDLNSIHHSHIFICAKFTKKNIQVKSYRLGTTRGRVNNDKMYIFGWSTLLRGAHFPAASCLREMGGGLWSWAQLSYEKTPDMRRERATYIDFRERVSEQQCLFCVLVKQTALGALRGATARLKMGPAVYDTSQDLSDVW